MAAVLPVHALPAHVTRPHSTSQPAATLSADVTSTYTTQQRSSVSGAGCVARAIVEIHLIKDSSMHPFFPIVPEVSARNSDARSYIISHSGLPVSIRSIMMAHPSEN